MNRTLAARVAVLVAAIIAVTASTARPAHAAFNWFNGGLVNSISYTCPGPIIPSMEILGVGAYAGYWTDITDGIPNGTSPRVGDVFWAHINIAAVGAACQGFGIVPTIRLPAGVNIAIDATNKLQCFYTSDFEHVAPAPVAAGECLQQMVQTFDGFGQPVYAIRAHPRTRCTTPRGRSPARH